MIKAFIGFLVGVILTIVVIAVVWSSFVDMTFPVTRDYLERDAEMKLFMHEMTQLHDGTHDMDTYHTWFSFQTSITNPADYFSRVDAAVGAGDWKLLDSHNDFRLYVSKWKPAAGSELRLETAVRFDPKDKTVSIERQRRYD